MTRIAIGKIQFIVGGDRAQQVPGPLKVQFRVRVQDQIGLKRPADTMSVIDIGPWPTTMRSSICVQSEYQATTKQSDQRGCLQLMLRVPDETADLLRRLATTALDVPQCGILEIRAIKFADSVIAQSRTLANNVSSGLMADHAQGQFELATLSGVPIIG